MGRLWGVIRIFAKLAFASAYSPEAKGKSGEAWIRELTLDGLPTGIYYQFHDVTLPTSYGTTQIDHMVVSRFGIFVIETKNMAGWIFGGPHQQEWTQVLFRDSYKFRNPLRQNRVHLDALQAILKMRRDTLRSVVVFVGDCEFKNPMPVNVLKGRELVSYIRSLDVEVLRDSDVLGAVAEIQRKRLAPSRETHRHHVLNLRSRPRPSAEVKCPKCGRAMVLRVARTGFRAGDKFWGCSGYPGCKGIRNLA
jgi:restriction system protein